jgi:arginine repressor
MPKKGQQYTTMTDEVRLALVRYKKDHPGATQKQLIKWLEDTHQLKVSQATVSGTFKRLAELLTKATTSNLSSKRQKTMKFPIMEAALAEWSLPTRNTST